MADRQSPLFGFSVSQEMFRAERFDAFSQCLRWDFKIWGVLCFCSTLEQCFSTFFFFYIE